LRRATLNELSAQELAQLLQDIMTAATDYVQADPGQVGKIITDPKYDDLLEQLDDITLHDIAVRENLFTKTARAYFAPRIPQADSPNYQEKVTQYNNMLQVVTEAFPSLRQILPPLTKAKTPEKKLPVTIYCAIGGEQLSERRPIERIPSLLASQSGLERLNKRGVAAIVLQILTSGAQGASVAKTALAGYEKFVTVETNSINEVVITLTQENLDFRFVFKEKTHVQKALDTQLAASEDKESAPSIGNVQITWTLSTKEH
jgi:hypothetical protein